MRYYFLSLIFSQGYVFANKSPDSLGWQDLSAADIISRVTSKVSAGSIIETLLQDGYTFVPISEILLQEDYTIPY